MQRGDRGIAEAFTIRVTQSNLRDLRDLRANSSALNSPRAPRYTVDVQRATPSFATVRRLARDLPRVEEGTAWGSPALKVDGKMFACLAIHRSAEPDSLVVQVPFADRDELIANAPDIYYITDHYVDHPTVLVRLSRIDSSALRDLLKMGWQFISTKGRRATPRKRR